ncbi:MAG TPA: UDP-N-acetylmuramoyl-tripeptide--D-alanyl-D-alanine ligase [Firmicutes bacterium]|nr:UDP-N-acetylmuramoyl-tripeptide--D-alanyl-D-alanine ligase [Bacillota bacterium]
MTLSIGEILPLVRGELLSGSVDTTFAGVSTDSRTLVPGDLFFALIGERYDGHDYVGDAISKGACGVVISRVPASLEALYAAGARPPGRQAAVIKTTDTLAALQAVARYVRRRVACKVVAVTGSTGKTTTKDMTASILSTRLRVVKSESNFNNEIGLPLTLLGLDETIQASVVEMGMRALGEIKLLSEIAEPDVGVVTNVGITHLELLGSVDNIAKAKSELISSLPSGGFAVLNADDPRVAGMAELTYAQVVLYGTRPGCDIRAEDIKTLGLSGTSATLVTPAWAMEVHIPVPGRHNVMNALAAAGAAMCLGLGPEEIKRGLEAFTLSPMRMQVIDLGNDVTLINDAYNANPASVRAALETLSTAGAGRRKVAVLGDMLELGPVSQQAHREAGVQALDSGVDVLITVGRLGEEIGRGFGEALRARGIRGREVHSVENPADAASFLKEVIRPGDVILVKASRRMQLDMVASELVATMKAMAVEDASKGGGCRG